MNKNINIQGSVVKSINDFHETMCRNVPMQVALLASTILFGNVPSEASIDAVRARLGDSKDVWIFPLLKQCVHTKTLMSQGFSDTEKADRQAAYTGMAALFLAVHGGVLGLADRVEGVISAMEARVEAAIMADETVDESDLLYIKVPKSDAPVDIKFDHGNVKARLLEVRVDKDGNMVDLPDDLPAEIKASLESHVAQLRASGAI